MGWSIEFGRFGRFFASRNGNWFSYFDTCQITKELSLNQILYFIIQSHRQLKLSSQSRTRTWERTNFHFDVEKLLSENAVSFSLHIMEIAKLCNLLAMAALKESVREENEFPALPAGDCLRCSAAERLRRREKNFLLAARRNVVH